MAIYCSILSTYLLPSSDYQSTTSHRKELFDIALKTIISLGSTYPEQFQAVVASSASLKSAIEQAVILNKTNAEAAQQKIEEMNKRKQQQSKPTIQLKMNFGSFN